MQKCNDNHQPIFNKNHSPAKRGPSSFNMHNSELAFERIGLKQNQIFVDLGCGAGEYSLYASRIVGTNGLVYALDIYPEILDGLADEAKSLGLTNIVTIESNICESIPLKNSSTDHCLLATVMHAQKITGKCKNLFPEIKRILKPGAQLAIIECKKEDKPFGPPLSMRISPSELERGVCAYGFRKTAYIDLGYNYMVLFSNAETNFP